MISPEQFVDYLNSKEVNFFTGVPDSLLKQFGSYLATSMPSSNHVIAANEGAAVSLALGYHLATNKVPVIYLQNSGIGNTINPLLSLADKEVYATPMLLIIGWRGQPGVKDEPQHIKQGRVMEQLLNALEIPFLVLSKKEQKALSQVDDLLKKALEVSQPVALLVEKDTFKEPRNMIEVAPTQGASLTREQALNAVISVMGDNDIAVSTTGMLSRELFEIRASSNDYAKADFLTVGGMGHASSIAQGIAIALPGKQIWCLDGDGALLMHMGTTAVISKSNLKNFIHVVFNNGVHDSVGGQPTAIDQVDIKALALANGYTSAYSEARATDIKTILQNIKQTPGTHLLEIAVKPGARKDLGRPTRSPLESKQIFMNTVGK